MNHYLTKKENKIIKDNQIEFVINGNYTGHFFHFIKKKLYITTTHGELIKINLSSFILEGNLIFFFLIKLKRNYDNYNWTNIKCKYL